MAFKNLVWICLTLYFVLNYDDIDKNLFNSSDIQEVTAFDNYITDQDMKKNYSVGVDYGNHLV